MAELFNCNNIFQSQLNGKTVLYYVTCAKFN